MRESVRVARCHAKKQITKTLSDKTIQDRSQHLTSNDNVTKQLPATIVLYRMNVLLNSCFHLLNLL